MVELRRLKQEIPGSHCAYTGHRAIRMWFAPCKHSNGQNPSSSRAFFIETGKSIQHAMVSYSRGGNVHSHCSIISLVPKRYLVYPYTEQITWTAPLKIDKIISLIFETWDICSTYLHMNNPHAINRSDYIYTGFISCRSEVSNVHWPGVRYPGC